MTRLSISRGLAILHGVMVDDLDGEADTLRGYTSLRTGVEPDIQLFRAEAEEAALVGSVILEGDKDVAATGVRLATMHRMKGLEFQHVLLVSVSDGVVPLAAAIASEDPTTRSAALQQERCLLYVACTRARDELVICGFGKPSPLCSTPTQVGEHQLSAAYRTTPEACRRPPLGLRVRRHRPVVRRARTC